MKLAAIIVNYKTAELTAQVAAALLKELAPVGDFHLYVVDNCSQDGSVDRLRARAAADRWGDRASVVAAPRNGGYGYGINVGIELAMASPNPPEYYFILNSDAFVDPGSLATMIAFMDEHPEAGLCGGNIRGTDGREQASAFKFPTAVSELNDAARTAIVAKLLSNPTVSIPLPAQPDEVEWIAGTCMLVRRAVFERIGLFDEGFFLYFEEVDFCQRARRAGWRSYCLPAATVTHIGSVSTGMGDESRPMPSYWFDSRHRYFLKHHGRPYAILCDVCWVTGFVIGEAKRSLLRRPVWSPRHMFRDFVRNSLLHLASGKTPGPDDVIHNGISSGSDGGDNAGNGASRSSATGQGATNGAADVRAPDNLGALELLAEDFATYDRDVFEPGFWAVTTHRLGRRASASTLPPVKLALDLAYKTMFTGVDWIWGIHLPRSVELGRRVRLWHNGCMLLTARSIGNDVQIRHDTTFAPVRGTAALPEMLPVIEDRADIGSGACVLGGVHVGHDAVVGANSVVLKNVMPHATVLGVPARIVPS